MHKPISEGAPSFEEMGKSIDNLIARYRVDLIQINFDDVPSLESVDEDIVISELDKQDHSNVHQFILSFLWHIMKVSTNVGFSYIGKGVYSLYL